ncbi:MAG TPA: ABC transporter ATP-binding protein [Casimicrobiaceae bacterium]|nr:ABC transporter ATP-binding protein [Casimicrobiaceae bacterium]
MASPVSAPAPVAGASTAQAAGQPGAAFVHVEGISKGFRLPRRARRSDGQEAELPVLENVDLAVARGEFVSLLGSSGCGKTTLLRILSGLVTPDAGHVTVAGKAVTAPRRDVCMVFQTFALLPWRSVLDNVAFPLEIDGMGRSERVAVAQRYIELVGLAGFERSYPHELSGGMQQRVGIARALTRNPTVLLMDEPFAALDAQTREVLQEDLLRIWTETRSTIVFVTHSIDEALILSDRVVVFRARPGAVKAIIAPPFRDLRLSSDVRSHPEFSSTRAEIRELLAY